MLQFFRQIDFCALKNSSHGENFPMLSLGKKAMLDVFLQNYTLKWQNFVKLSNFKVILMCFDGKIELFSISE